MAQKYGAKALLMNYELRLPFLMYYFPAIKYVGQIFGVFFVDMGVAWNDKFPRFSDRNNWGTHEDSNITNDKVKSFKSLVNFSSEKFKILLPGRLTRWKGQEMFIEAIRLVKEKIPEKSFCAVILGGDQGRNVYKKKLVGLVQQYRLNKIVKFIEHCEEMPVAYRIANLVISSSIEPEAFGRVSVEAQSMEKLIIASNIGGSRETIINDKTGLLFEAGKAKSLSQKIIEALKLDNTTLKIMGNEGRKNVIKKFNIEKMCFSTYSEYKKLINA